MVEILPCEGEGAIFFGRRPANMLDAPASRHLAAATGSPYKFAYARTALKYGLMAVDFQPGDQLLVPELICESLLETLPPLGIEVAYYPVRPDLSPVWDQLTALLTPRVKALVLVHYFGQPRSLPECLAFCRRHGLLLIEDNAHGYGGTWEGQPLGTFGTIGISAPRKSFPLKHGALLYLRDEKHRLDLTGLRPQPAATASRRGKQWLQKLMPSFLRQSRRARLDCHRRLGPPPPYGSQAAFRDPPLAGDYGMDAAVADFLDRQDLAAIGMIRRQIYQIWQQWAISQGLQPVFPELAAGALPLVFPAYSQSAAASRQWYERGHRAGVDIHSWPTLPPTIVLLDGGTMRLWERLVCFPIHQEMDPDKLIKRLSFI